MHSLTQRYSQKHRMEIFSTLYTQKGQFAPGILHSKTLIIHQHLATHFFNMNCSHSIDVSLFPVLTDSHNFSVIFHCAFSMATHTNSTIQCIVCDGFKPSLSQTPLPVASRQSTEHSWSLFKPFFTYF